MNIIERIEELRKERGWTKYRLAEEAMLTHSTLAAIYVRQTPPKIEILEMICNAFGITLAQFFASNDDAEIVSEHERELLKRYRRLPEEKKKAIFTLTEN